MHDATIVKYYATGRNVRETDGSDAMVRYNPKAVDEHIRRISKQLSEQQLRIKRDDVFSEAWNAAASWQDIHSPAAWHGFKAVEQQWLLDHKNDLPSTSAIARSLSQVPEVGFANVPNPGWLDGILDVTRTAGQYLGQINEMVERVANAMAPPLAGLARISEELARPVQGWQQMIRNIPKLQSFDGFWDQMQPIIRNFVILMKDAEEGRAALRASEFGFADHFWNIFYVRGFAHMHPQTRDANITRQLVSYTTTEIFVEQLGNVIGESKLMHKRWRIVEAACEAHAARKYDLAVPATLAQIEGTLVDLMLLKDLVKKEKGQFSWWTSMAISSSTVKGSG